MRLYSVTIKATITKTLEVSARNEDEALDIAHQEFSVLSDDAPESYEQDTVDWSDVTDYRERLPCSGE